MRFFVPAAWLFILAAALGSCGEKNASPASAPAAHPMEGRVWTCPMCPRVLALEKGKCPGCGMDLVNTSTAPVWTCLKHPIIAREEEGACPVCGRPLSSITMAVVWRCPEHPEEKFHAAGECKRCRSPLVEAYDPLPHGDHNPRHGGQFFMAPDQWHHLEGALPEKGIFRLYLYDDFTRPLPVAAASGHLEVPGAGDGPARKLPLRPNAAGDGLEAALGETFRLPFRATAVLRFEKTREKARFDFQFDSLSAEEPPAGAGGAAEARGQPKELEKELEPEEMLREILASSRKTRQALDGRRWQQVYVPALAAKDLALRLEERLEEQKLLDAGCQKEFQRALRQLVRGAWLLDLYGDLGDGVKAEEAYREFSAGAEGLKRILGENRSEGYGDQRGP
ncbi:MAG: hypothetical protein HY717_23025 [Planctomycetes bacterium]|nr:hypothetical protein [Planctomycetota bacterium]